MNWPAFENSIPKGYQVELHLGRDVILEHQHWKFHHNKLKISNKLGMPGKICFYVESVHYRITQDPSSVKIKLCRLSK